MQSSGDEVAFDVLVAWQTLHWSCSWYRRNNIHVVRGAKMLDCVYVVCFLFVCLFISCLLSCLFVGSGMAEANVHWSSITHAKRRNFIA